MRLPVVDQEMGPSERTVNEKSWQRHSARSEEVEAAAVVVVAAAEQHKHVSGLAGRAGSLSAAESFANPPRRVPYPVHSRPGHR